MREREGEREREIQIQIQIHNYYSHALSLLSGGRGSPQQQKYTCTHFEYHEYRDVILKV